MELKELYEHKGTLVRQLNDMSDRVAEEARAFTPDEIESFDKLQTEHNKIVAEIATVERAAQAKSLVAAKTETVQRDSGRATTRDLDNSFRAWSLRQAGLTVPDYLKRSAERANADIYGDTFVIRDQSIGTPADGGYTVNSNIYSGLIEARKAYGGMAPLCTQLNTDTGESLAFATNNDSSNVGAWGSELTAISNTSAVFGQATLSAYLNVSGVFPVSLQLVQDSHAPIESWIGGALGTRLARNLADAIVNGNGSGKPTGIKATATSAFTTASSPTDLSVSDLIDLYIAVNASYRSNAKWMFNSTTLGELMKLVDDTGRPLLMPDYNGQGGGVGTLFGKPVVIDDACPNTAAGLKPIFFGDFSAYYIRRAGGTTIAVDRSLYFKEMGLAFVAYERVDGKLLDATAVKTITMHA